MKTFSGELQRVGNNLLLRQDNGQTEYLDWLLDNYDRCRVLVVIEPVLSFYHEDDFAQSAREYVAENFSPDEVYPHT